MTQRRSAWLVGPILLILAGCWTASAAQPETVMITFRAKSGSEAELARVIARHWTTARRLKLVSSVPHVTLRGAEEGGKAYFIEIFTWRDAHTPDAAPVAIRNIWNDMNSLVEDRSGHRGLDIAQVSAIAR